MVVEALAKEGFLQPVHRMGMGGSEEVVVEVVEVVEVVVVGTGCMAVVAAAAVEAAVALWQQGECR